MKIITAYLPQFHTIPESDKWWGKGFTEWTNVKKATPLYAGHNQPRIPYHKNYYNLLDDNRTWHWQAELAKKYGIYGFSIYHYWFNGKMLLEKPMENLLKDKSVDIHYCVSWANEKWTNGWVSSENRVLIEPDYSDRNDWIKHFYYLLPFFQDSRYIYLDGKPLVIIYVPYLMGKYLKPFIQCWRELAIKNGFKGLTLAFQHARNYNDPLFDQKLFDYGMEFQPDFTRMRIQKATQLKKIETIALNKMFELSSWLQKNWGIYIHKKRKNTDLDIFSYDDIWAEILNSDPINENAIPGAFVDWDNTSRKGNAGSVADGATPEKFKQYLSQQIYRTKKIYKKELLILFAWNEWAECGYLEPDEKNGFKMLEAVKEALIENGEFNNFGSV